MIGRIGINKLTNISEGQSSPRQKEIAKAKATLEWAESYESWLNRAPRSKKFIAAAKLYYSELQRIARGDFVNGELGECYMEVSDEGSKQLLLKLATALVAYKLDSNRVSV